MSNPFVRVARGWHSFWFRPQPVSTLALFRIAFGVLTTLWTLSLAPQLLDFFGPDSALPAARPLGPGTWSLQVLTGDSTAAAIVVWLVTLLAALGVTVGYQTRLASVVLFVCLLSVQRHAAFTMNTGDGLIRVLAFYLMFAPAGAAISVDRWRAEPDRFWEGPLRAPWALRLMQIQLSVVYLSTFWDKMQGDTWRGGTAVSFALRATEVQRVPSPTFVTDSLGLTQLVTLGTLGLELALGILVWNRAARPWILALGVLLHLSIEVSITVGFFSFTMLVLYLVFVPTERATALVEACRTRLATWRASATEVPEFEPVAGPPPTGPPPTEPAGAEPAGAEPAVTEEGSARPVAFESR